MPNRTLRVPAALALLVVALGSAACRDIDPAVSDNRADAVPTAPQAANGTVVALPGRSLAANCFQCHGTNGEAGELKIAGESSSEIVNHMNSFRARNPRSNIMNVHALGYTPAEITLIADYFSQQGH